VDSFVCLLDLYVLDDVRDVCLFVWFVKLVSIGLKNIVIYNKRKFLIFFMNKLLIL